MSVSFLQNGEKLPTSIRLPVRPSIYILQVPPSKVKPAMPYPVSQVLVQLARPSGQPSRLQASQPACQPSAPAKQPASQVGRSTGNFLQDFVPYRNRWNRQQLIPSDFSRVQATFFKTLCRSVCLSRFQAQSCITVSAQTNGTDAAV